ncbi:MAG TPA: hypothetical protein VMW29_03520 [Candidatus Bathyarchaeia archaeon]|nr:hypothetical protein [Candidatus Bathyarchaeia archaeon]
MSELEYSSEIIESLLSNPETNILVSCMNGRNRSKTVAREIAELGYTNVRTLGVKDYRIPRDEKEEEINWAQLVVPTGVDVEAEIRRINREVTTLGIRIENKEHYFLTAGTEQQKERIRVAIRERLSDAGFVNFQEKQNKT